MKIEFRPRFIQTIISTEGSYQIRHEDHLMTVLKGSDTTELQKIPFFTEKNEKWGWYGHTYQKPECYTGMSANFATGVLGRTRCHLNPASYNKEYKPGIKEVMVFTCIRGNLPHGVICAMEHTFTQLSLINGEREVINTQGTAFNLSNEEELYDWGRSYAIYYTMLKNQGYTHYLTPQIFLPDVIKGKQVFKLDSTDVVVQEFDKRSEPTKKSKMALKVLAGSRFPVPVNLVTEHSIYMSMFNELVKSNVVLPVYNELTRSVELLFVKDHTIEKRFNIDELTSLFTDELVNNAKDLWRNSTQTLNNYLNGNNT